MALPLPLRWSVALLVLELLAQVRAATGATVGAAAAQPLSHSGMMLMLTIAATLGAGFAIAATSWAPWWRKLSRQQDDLVQQQQELHLQQVELWRHQEELQQLQDQLWLEHEELCRQQEELRLQQELDKMTPQEAALAGKNLLELQAQRTRGTGGSSAAISLGLGPLMHHEPSTSWARVPNTPTVQADLPHKSIEAGSSGALSMGNPFATAGRSAAIAGVGSALAAAGAALAGSGGNSSDASGETAGFATSRTSGYSRHTDRSGGSGGSSQHTSPSCSMSATLSGSDSKQLLSHNATDVTLLPPFNTVPFSEVELSKQLGEGSFGQVWLAKYCQTAVAVKVLVVHGFSSNDQHQEQMHQLVKEAGLMAKLRHPNVCQYLGACLEPPSIIMEYCPRKSLDVLLASATKDSKVAKQLPWMRLLSMASDAAKGMLYLHTRSPPVAHRDFKSANLLVDGQWHVKVADFNLSRPIEAGVAVSTLAATNPRWLAPCILAGQKGGLAADVWSFGMVLWELMTWKLPFEDLNPFQIISLVQKTGSSCLPIPAPMELPAGPFVGYNEYVALMQACWAREPNDRPTMEHVATTLRNLLVGELQAHSASGSKALS